MVRILSVFGTRPEAIKLAPVIRALSTRADRVVSRVCVTAQHRGMLDQMLGHFSIRPDHDLDIMTEGQSPAHVTSRVLAGMEPVLRAERPDWVLVQGDTTTALAAALAAKYAGVSVGHVEAGLRTHDRLQPFPEEINRQAVTRLAELHFAPTPGAKANLLREGVDPRRIIVSGNPVIDALTQTVAELDPRRDGYLWDALPEGSRIVLVTAHRRENLGTPLREICLALKALAERFAGTVTIFYPVHPRREVHRVAHELLREVPNIRLILPLDYRALIHLMLRCEIIITDSGGLQEEAPHLGKPVLVLRNVTERPEAVAAGTVRLVGVALERIVEETARLLEDRVAYSQMARPVQLYGDGRASERIVRALLGEPVSEWAPAVPATHRGRVARGSR